VAWRGHLWTVLPFVSGKLRPPRLPELEPWRGEVHDDVHGRIELHGLHAGRDHEAAVVLVHGLGGGLDSPYMERAAAAVARTGMGCLMLAVRGAERAGEDIYHAGQTADIEAALRSPALAAYENVYLLGFSLGGHMALRVGLDPPPNLRAIAAVCSPLDLAKSSRAIDAPLAWVYRTHILRGLREIYREVAARREVPTPVRRVEAARTIREWDSLTVVPRYGFGTVDEYYASMSVGPRLDALQVPALIVHSEADPMVPTWTVDEALATPPPHVEVRRLAAGGHVGFPNHVDLEAQILSWFRGRS
jgi:predicted alpha/beta-fold hydrolase